MSVRMEIGILGISAVILASEMDQFNSIVHIRVPSIITNILIQSINQRITLRHSSYLHHAHHQNNVVPAEVTSTSTSLTSLPSNTSNGKKSVKYGG